MASLLLWMFWTLVLLAVAIGLAYNRTPLRKATITLVHVVEYVPVEPMGEALLPSVQIEEGLLENAQTRLRQLAAELGLQEAKRVVEVGNIKSEVLRVAADTGADLIVLGARERHGVAVLLNFTEDTVLHAAPCDVLAVRLKRS